MSRRETKNNRTEKQVLNGDEFNVETLREKLYSPHETENVKLDTKKTEFSSQKQVDSYNDNKKDRLVNRKETKNTSKIDLSEKIRVQDEKFSVIENNLSDSNRDRKDANKESSPDSVEQQTRNRYTEKDENPNNPQIQEEIESLKSENMDLVPLKPVQKGISSDLNGETPGTLDSVSTKPHQKNISNDKINSVTVKNNNTKNADEKMTNKNNFSSEIPDILNVQPANPSYEYNPEYQQKKRPLNESSIIKDKKIDINERKSRKVADHYNRIKSMDQKRRKQSEILNLRNINNFIKAVLINLYVHQNDTVLDLGCGKGGDLLKYKIARIRYLHGIDIAEESIKEFKKRIINQKRPFEIDLSINDICNDKIDLNRKFDVISLQFAIHYAFESEITFKTLFETIKRHSKSNTHVILTTIDQSTIIKMYNEKLVINNKCGYCGKEDMCVGNPLFHIQLGDITRNRIFGNSYTFFLKEAVDRCEEYLVPCAYLVDEFEKNGYEMIENKCFSNLLDKYENDFQHLKRRMVPNELKKDEIEIMGIYRAIVFKKLDD